MPRAIRFLLLAGVLLTAAALVAMAVTAGPSAPEPGRLRAVPVLLYGLGAGLMIAAGIWWLVRFTQRRNDPR